MFRRYVIVGFVRDHGMHRYADQPKGFLTHSGALIAAMRANRNSEKLQHAPAVEWHPIRARTKVRTGDQRDRWVRAADLPIWDPYLAAPQRVSERGIDS